MTRRPLIVHLAVDVNTPQRPRTTTAIEWLIDELTDYDNVVIGYRRTPDPRLPAPVEVPGRAYRLFDFPFFGFKYGIGLFWMMRRAGLRAIALLEREGIRPDLIHAHKLTFEALAGWYVARHFGVPLFISLRGQTEARVIRRKRSIRWALRRAARRAARVYHVSAWFRDEYHRTILDRPAQERLLPNIVRNIAPTIAPQPFNDRFVAIFNLNTWRNKGLRPLLDAFMRARAIEPGIRLDVIGAGSDRSVAEITADIATRGLSDIVTMTGPIPNAELLARLPHYRGLLLPAVHETFGMVYVEALFAGVPVLYTRGTGIDGYLDGLTFARGIDAGDIDAIVAIILDFWRAPQALRDAIAAAAPRLFETFDPAPNLARYRTDVAAVLGLPAHSE